MKNTCLFLFILSVFLSCRSGDTRGKAENAKIDSAMLGYWIPEKINWQRPHSGDAQIDSVVRSAYFKVLRFDAPDHFSVFATTMNYPKTYDSLIFEYEPGVDIYSGTWKEEGGKTIAGYRLVYSGNENKANETPVTDTVLAGPGGSLLFDSVRYVKTTRLDAASLKKIEAYRAEAGVK